MFEQITKFANETTDNVSRTVNDINDTITKTVNDTNVSERFTTTSDQVLDAVLDANRRIVDMAVTTADRVSEQFNVELPFADRLPTASVAGERYLEFVERAVSLNRDMNQRVAEMITADNAKAASDKVVGAAKNVADTATKTVTDAGKTVAKKAPAKKAAARKAPAKKAAAKRPARKTVAKKAVASK
ncbi:MAG TPA: hypothetical protein VMW33_03900 [Ilumatobacteraceae bacterium]|nr:hypothetical protein [Ilumatobacteraceae bacterium]